MTLGSFLKKPVLRTMAVAYGLMFAQQFSGINAIIFYCETIFRQTGVDLDSLLQMVIFAVVQVIACVASASLIDQVSSLEHVPFRRANAAFSSPVASLAIYSLRSSPFPSLSLS